MGKRIGRKRRETAKKYHSSKSISRSQLFVMRKCPELFKYELENKKEATPAMIFGQALHKFVLEPENFFDEFAIIPKVDKRTSEGKELYSVFLNEAAEKIIISQEDFETIQKMSEKVNENKYAKFLLTGKKETSYYWTDDLTGEKLKCRPDIKKDIDSENGVIADLKSTSSALTEDFMRDCIKCGYDLQVAMYKEGVEKYEQKHYDFVFIAVEKTPPYVVNVLKADELLYKRGYDLFREYIGRVADCRKTNNWYGYNGFSGMINNIGLPPYLLKEIE